MGIDFINNLDDAFKYENAVTIMIWGMTDGIFTGRKLSDYNNIKAKSYDYFNARSIINGDKNHQTLFNQSFKKGALIESYVQRYEQILRATSRLPEGFN